ncbi:DNA polymerase I [Calidifontibacillus erzurumensis]|uniref:DNA polymerase I n=1 Tax=Calidifontibacillus erzurumensis TaxID=2741433 RepID=A0A8J8KBY8_9BACI|nr:DNA polymerase I [Calidifontibacillus erzurumensis]NSL51518.1 DNA polymerase I [Calidifontibacillus erzurumensis]
MSNQKIVLIDGNSIAYRAFFALPLLNNDKGVYTNAVYGFTMILMKVLEEENPTHILVAFDAGKTTFRHQTFSEYKGGREKTPLELSEQLPFIREVLDAFNIPRYELEQYEADDIIGTLAKQAEKEKVEVKIITGDKDLLQLVSDYVTVLHTKKGITDVEVYDVEKIKEKYQLTPKQIIDMKGLMGDSSDNIPGVPGVGEKTAIKLLTQFGTLENTLDSVHEVSGKKLQEKLIEHKEQALMSKQLATIHCDAPIDITLQDINRKEMNKENVIKIFKELGFTSLLERIGDADETSQAEFAEIEYKIVDELSEALLLDEAALVVEIIDENYHEADIVGFSIVNKKEKLYIPTEIALQSAIFKNWLEDESKKKIVFDAKQAMTALKWRGISLKGVEFDLLIASYLLNPSETAHEITDVAKRYGYMNIHADEVVYGKGAKRKVPSQDELADHLVRKADAIFQVKDQAIKHLKDNNQYDLFRNLELPLSFILSEMEYTGVMVDINRLEKMGQELDVQLKEIEEKIYELAGEPFNINSPKQLGAILFEKLQLPPVKKTKTGYSTSADVLEKLADMHEMIPLLLHYRQLGKLKSTYIEGLLKVVHRDTSKIHTRFNQALTQTGRLSSTEPNLQNIPIRMEEGRKIRQAFIPSEEDWVIFAADYSQIELRVLAHIAKDEKLIEAFREGKDIHTKTAMDVFHVDEKDVTPNMRRQAKAVNFGIIYGISDFGLSQNLGITRKEAAKFIEQYFKSFPGVKKYMDEIVLKAKENGYVTTLLNRRRYLPDITSRNFNVRSFAERTAMNTPIQGSAADIIKKAMIDMVERLKKENLKTRLLLQVHDELIFEAPKSEIEKLTKIVPEVMENAIQLDVPLKVDYSYGPTWFDAK